MGKGGTGEKGKARRRRGEGSARGPTKQGRGGKGKGEEGKGSRGEGTKGGTRGEGGDTNEAQEELDEERIFKDS